MFSHRTGLGWTFNCAQSLTEEVAMLGYTYTGRSDEEYSVTKF